MPIIAGEDRLIEDSADSAQETLFPSLKAHVICLALGLLIGIHSGLIRNASTRETSFRYLCISGKVYSRRSHHSSVYRRLGIGLSFSAVDLTFFFLRLRSRWGTGSGSLRCLSLGLGSVLRLRPITLDSLAARLLIAVIKYFIHY